MFCGWPWQRLVILHLCLLCAKKGGGTFFIPNLSFFVDQFSKKLIKIKIDSDFSLWMPNGELDTNTNTNIKAEMALNVSGDGVIHCNYEWFLYTKDGVGYTNWYGQHTTEKLQLNNIRDNWRALVSPDRLTALDVAFWERDEALTFSNLKHKEAEIPPGKTMRPPGTGADADRAMWMLKKKCVAYETQEWLIVKHLHELDAKM